MIRGTELYDHSSPDDNFFNDENINLANKPEMKQIVEELHLTFQVGWRAAIRIAALQLTWNQVKIDIYTLIFCAILCHANST